MGEDKERGSGASSSRRSSSRREKEREDRHRHHHRDSKHRHDDNRKHSSRSDSNRKERAKDDDGHRHRHHHSSHLSSHRDREGEEDRNDRKKRRREDDERRHDSRSHHKSHRNEASPSSDPKQPASDFIPTSASLDLTSHATTSTDTSGLKRDDWMLSHPDKNSDDASYFSTLGQARVKQPRPEKSDPEKLKISSRELNIQLVQRKTVDEYTTPNADEGKKQYGGPGYQWRMMKLKRTLEAAEVEGRDLEEVALERFATMEDFEDALEERRVLDGQAKGKKREEEGGRSTPTLQSVARRSYMLASGGSGERNSGTDDSEPSSRPGSRQGFKRP